MITPTHLAHLWNAKTKPPGSLGRLETVAARVALIQQTERPRADRATVVVVAGDHGLAEAGVSAYPSAVTAQMVNNFLAGGAAISCLARCLGLRLVVVNAGVAADLSPHPNLIDLGLGRSTGSMLEGPALTREQTEAAVRAGRDLVSQLGPVDLVAVGEMGIGNSSCACLLTSRLLGLELEDCVGPGAGLSPSGVEKKRNLLAQVLRRHSQAQEPLSILASFGGWELAVMVGLYLELASQQIVIVVDGFISSAALLCAVKLRPEVLESCIFSHLSPEPGHRHLLNFFDREPLLALGLRLGEGSGAALAVPLIQAAVECLNGMASFQQAGVSREI